MQSSVSASEWCFSQNFVLWKSLWYLLLHGFLSSCFNVLFAYRFLFCLATKQPPRNRIHVFRWLMGFNTYMFSKFSTTSVAELNLPAFRVVKPIYRPKLGWRKVQCLCMHAWVLSRFSCVQLYVTLSNSLQPCQALLSIEFSRQEYWSGWPCPPLGDLPNSGIEPASLTSSALSVGFFTTSTTWKAHSVYCRYHILCRIGSSCSKDFEECIFKDSIWSEIAGCMTFFWLVDSEIKG